MKTDASRPYWHVDLKWICGIIFFFLLVGSLLLHTLTVLTAREVAVPVAASVVGSFMTRGEGEEGGDPTEDIAALRQKIAEQGTGRFQPFEGQPVYITEEDLDTLTSEEIRTKIFEDLAALYYDVGVEELAAQQTSDPEQRAAIERQAGLIKLISNDTHLLLAKIRTIVALLLLLPLIGLIFFSWGAGRLVSPGILLFLVGLPGTILTFAISRTADQVQHGGPFASLPPETARHIADSLFPSFATVCFTGLALLVAAIVVGLWNKRKLATNPEPK